MSEEPKITSVEKTKDPRRVEAGKRLGVISKQAKERKAREQSEAHKAEHDVEKNEWTSPVVGVVFAGAITGLILYYTYSKKYKTVETVKTVKTVETVETVETGTKDETGAASESKPKRVYKELDTLD